MAPRGGSWKCFCVGLASMEELLFKQQTPYFFPFFPLILYTLFAGLGVGCRVSCYFASILGKGRERCCWFLGKRRGTVL